MTNKKVKITIDRLNIRMKGITSQDVKGETNSMVSELLKEFAMNEKLVKEKGMVRFESVNAGKVQLQRGSNNCPDRREARIASGIANAVSLKLTNLNKK